MSKTSLNGIELTRIFHGRLVSAGEEFAWTRYDQFVTLGGQWPTFADARSITVKSGWWVNPVIANWVTTSVKSSHSTLKHLTIHPGNGFAPSLVDTLASLDLSLDSVTLANLDPALASRLFQACPAPYRVLQVTHHTDDSESSTLSTLDTEVQEVLVVSKGNLLHSAPFLHACLDDPASRSLKRITVQGQWVKTLAMMKSWKQFAERARGLGVGVTLIDVGGGFSEPEVVLDTT